MKENKEPEMAENNDGINHENLDSDAETVAGNEEVSKEGHELFNTPDLKYLTMKENFLQKYLFKENWGSHGSKQRVVAFDSMIKYLQKTRRLVDTYPSISSEVYRDNLRLIMLKQLPIPDDQLDDAKLHDVAYGGNDDTDEEILKKLEAELVNQRRVALLHFTFAEMDRVNCLENYEQDSPPQAVVEDEDEELFNEENVITKVPQKVKELRCPNVHNATSYLKKLHLEILA